MLNRSRPPSDRFRFCRDLVSRSKSWFEVSRVEGENIVRTIDHFFFGTRFDWLRLLSRRLLADWQFLLSFFIYASFRFEDFSNTVIFTICFFVNVGKCWRKEIFSRDERENGGAERAMSIGDANRRRLRVRPCCTDSKRNRRFPLTSRPLKIFATEATIAPFSLVLSFLPS